MSASSNETNEMASAVDPGLSRRTLGVPDVTLMIITASAPLGFLPPARRPSCC